MEPSDAETQHAVVSGREQGEVEGGGNQWKGHAPYRVHSNNEGFRALYEASCHCGKVQYQLSREKPLDAKFCHCKTCQVLHGAPFQWAAIFRKEDINFRNGYNDLVWYDSGERITRHKLPCKVSCAYCRSPIMDEGRHMILLFPTLIKFKSREEKEKFNPTSHIFYGSRVIDIPDKLPKWTGLNGESDLIDDCTPKAEGERKRGTE